MKHWREETGGGGERDDDRRCDFSRGDDLHRLARRQSAPDYTVQIMDRLGFERVSAVHARRWRNRRRLVRTGALFAVLLVAAGLMHSYTLTERARRADMPTIENAVPASLGQSERAVEGFSRALRHLIPSSLLDAPADDPRFVTPTHYRFHWRVPHLWEGGEIVMPEQSRVRWSGLL